MIEPVIEVYFDPNGSYGGPGTGCYRCRLRDSHGLHDAGNTPEVAVKALIRNIVCHADYKDPGKTKLKYAHLPASIEGYTMERLNDYGNGPSEFPWYYVDAKHEQFKVREAREVAQIIGHILTPRRFV